MVARDRPVPALCLRPVPISAVRTDRLFGPVGKASASRAAALGSISAYGVDLFLVRVIPVT